MEGIKVKFRGLKRLVLIIDGDVWLDTERYTHLSPDHLQDAIKLNLLKNFDTLSTLK